jgi:hypothetical protein
VKQKVHLIGWQLILLRQKIFSLKTVRYAAFVETPLNPQIFVIRPCVKHKKGEKKSFLFLPSFDSSLTIFRDNLFIWFVEILLFINSNHVA